ncbi:MAG TPA: choice-of-anchor tandem repeat GloVer-containing protein [Terriglobia bacterium]|jgi:uncharacterized repeat protein (TIGR03803 family)|nr:choice-of-anchor tandem repeat GloVer-containing protein [Terriglobia bacterium]
MNRLNRGKEVCLAIVLWATTALALSAQVFSSQHSFDYTDGSLPQAALVQAANGNLYGATYEGGANGNGGTIFQITPQGALTTLYNFCSRSACTDGNGPKSTLVQDAHGSFYGTTYQGGAYDEGMVFKLTPSGTLTALYSFCPDSGCPDGALPAAGAVEATNGNFYGTTYGGGASDLGTVFEVTPGGTLTTLYSFCAKTGCTDGSYPSAALIQASNGNFYGTTLFGGGSKAACSDGCGTAFEITPGGTLTTLYSFCSHSGCTDGEFPSGSLIQATDGYFYGTTSAGGNSACVSGCGTIFKISPGGTLSILHSFDGTDGSIPDAGLVQGSDGNLYGTTQGGGANGNGTAFKINPGGTLTTLYSFCSQGGDSCTDGAAPTGALLQDTNGSFYGTTSSGGESNASCVGGCGTVFRLGVSLSPFVKAQPGSGQVGNPVAILGTNLTGASSVSFNGTTAKFKVVSNSLITTTVPEAATTGTVRVVTPGGTLLSNVPFRVLP